MKHDFEYRFREPLADPEELGRRPPEHRRTVEGAMLIERDVAVPMWDGVRIYADARRTRPSRFRLSANHIER